MGRILCVYEHYRLAYFMNMPVGYRISFSKGLGTRLRPTMFEGSMSLCVRVTKGLIERARTVCVYICTNLLSIEHIG